MKWRNVGGFTRISKRVAEKRYCAGEIIYLCPCNLRPGSPWNPEVPVHLLNIPGGENASARFSSACFSASVDQFEFYNCNYAAGYYAAFYVKDEQNEQK